MAADAATPFEEAYAAGIAGQLPEPSFAPGRTALVRAAAAEPFALKGCVLTPDGPLERAYITVGDGTTIGGIGTRKPQGVRVHDTGGGVIVPGLIDLHGHPEFNVFAAWEPPRQFINRYAWRGSEVYRELVRRPQDRLIAALPQQTQLRYAEIRALVGGVTAIQGTSERIERLEEESLVRNVDRWIFGRHRARAMIDVPKEGQRDYARLEKIVTDIGAGEVDAFYVHLAEGRRDNPRSVEEWELVDPPGGGVRALTDATVIIHGSALGREQLGLMRDAGAKLVWSPQSNLRLYGETTLAAEALDVGVTIGLGADWLPSGSQSLLHEMKVARRELSRQGANPPARRLLEMVTSDAADIAAVGEELGRLREGLPADLVVFERRLDDPYENVLDAEPAWVELVMIDGDLPYGRADWLETLSAPADRERFEPLIAWGKRMLLDTSHTAAPATGGQPRLEDLRGLLVGEYPQVGPIFA
jgi:cytosine/adenosine deaminase-related metal-dependent hydrolase